MTTGAWPGFCVVGIGGHARSKLIPAIAANGQALRGVVSRQPPETLPDAPAYPTMDVALAALPSDTPFLIASPPALHFDQAMAALRAGRDVLVEKPAFLTVAEALAAADAAEASGAVLAEAFMHRHTRLHRRLLDHWFSGDAGATAIEIVFVVPSLPPGTFRQAPKIDASVLYDIGCYAFSLLVELYLPLDRLVIDRIERSGGEELLHISGSCGGIETNIRIGVAEAYENFVTLRREDGSSTRYSPFFYGRSGDRTIARATPGQPSSEETIADLNGFEAMLAVPRVEWAGSQLARTAQMIAVTASLERLGAALLALRHEKQ